MKIVNVMASSLDGRIAAFPMESDASRVEYGFLIPEDEQLLRDELAQADAVITGANSLRVTGTVADIRNARGDYPTWVIYSRHPETFDDAFWLQEQIPRILVADKFEDENYLVQKQSDKFNFKTYGTLKPAAFIVDLLRSKGCSRVLLFGGGFINLMFYQEGLVDELKLTLCPFIFAGLSSPYLVNPGLDSSVKFDLVASHAVRSHVFLHYRVKK